jgi:hypothetical protein
MLLSLLAAVPLQAQGGRGSQSTLLIADVALVDGMGHPSWRMPTS